MRFLLPFLMVLFCSTFVEAVPDLPDESVRVALFDKTVSEIERVDAIGIVTRDRSKKTTWANLKSSVRRRFHAASSWAELREAIHSLHNGFTNVHAYIKPGDAFPDAADESVAAEAVPLGFTYPELSFFVRHPDRTQVQNQEVAAAFDRFVDFTCRYPHRIGCAHAFVRASAEGQLSLGAASSLDFSGVRPSPSRRKIEAQSCAQTLERYGEGWNMEFSGRFSCLFSRSDTMLLKIKFFDHWGNRGMYCGPQANQGSACDDINHILGVLNRIRPDGLILDVQDNRGGAENTPWIAALALRAFTDLTVRYKKIHELDNADMRRQLFYFNDAAENWFQKLLKSKTYETIEYGAFLPPRADFCRGADDCAIAPIKRHKYSYDPKAGLILTNGGCVSSCDDLVWRLKDTNGWEVVGQTPVTDGAYARIEGGVAIENGKVRSFTWGDGGSPPVDSGSILIKYRIPISRTLDQSGHLREGDAKVLDRVLSHRKSEFVEQDAHLANSAYELIVLKLSTR